jgi:hypothetical protein
MYYVRRGLTSLFKVAKGARSLRSESHCRSRLRSSNFDARFAKHLRDHTATTKRLGEKLGLAIPQPTEWQHIEIRATAR